MGAFLVVFAGGADGLFVCSRLPWFMGGGGGTGVGDLQGGVGNALEVVAVVLETFEAALGNALDVVAAVETILEMVGMQPCLLPHRNRRLEHYASLVIVLLDLGWGRPCCVRTEDNESIVI